MFKMSTCGVALLLAGMVGLACGGQPGLNVAGGSSSGGQTAGQNDCEQAGGTCEQMTPGACLGGWSPNTGGYSCRSSTTSCCFPLSYSPCETAGGTCVWTAGTCPSGTVDNTSQYQWSQYECSSAGGPSICCMPSANGGASGVGGSSGGAGSSGATGGSGGMVGQGGAGGAGTGGASGSTGGSGGKVGGAGGSAGSAGGAAGGAGGVGGAAGGTGGTTICPAIACLLPNCPYGIVPSTSPCGCPTCAPAPDGGGDAGNTSDVAATGGSPGTDGAMADAQVPCSPQSKCPKDMVCGFSIVQGCSALGACLLRPSPLPCNAVVEFAACGCDGKTINWTGGCSPSIPDGFAPAPVVHNGACL